MLRIRCLSLYSEDGQLTASLFLPHVDPSEWVWIDNPCLAVNYLKGCFPAVGRYRDGN
jgi:hypothetical protein